jgi:hypothetical protein
MHSQNPSDTSRYDTRNGRLESIELGGKQVSKDGTQVTVQQDEESAPEGSQQEQKRHTQWQLSVLPE